MFETRREAFEEWFSRYGVLTSQSKYTLALSETRDKLAYYASNPIGGGAQNINASVYPEHSVYEFDDPIRLRNLFDDCTKQNSTVSMSSAGCRSWTGTFRSGRKGHRDA